MKAHASLTKFTTASLVAVVSLALLNVCQAHFIFLASEKSDDGKQSVQVYFAEEASADDPALLNRLKGMKVWQLRENADAKPVTTKREGDSLLVTVPAKEIGSSLFIARHDLGVFDRGGNTFRLKYYAKTGPEAGDSLWNKINTPGQQRLDVSVEVTGTTVGVHVRWKGEPVSGAEIKASGPGLEDFTGTSDEKGAAKFVLGKSGLYSIRARHIEKMPGELDGKPYPEVRHYSTLAVRILSNSSPVDVTHLPVIPQPVTSFGGAVLDGSLYVYGGHTGFAHTYSNADQSNQLRRLSLKSGEKWETLASGPKLQGLAMVAHQGKLYRFGGFTAKNADGEDQDLWSQDVAAVYDPQKNQWTDLPPLPEPRSSFDAAVLGNSIYVVGGWKMAGDAERVWHQTAWELDLSVANPEWKALPKTPFQRRAMAVAAHAGKLYVVGGMQMRGGPTKAVSIYDPETRKWTSGPDLAGEKGLTGFGASAFALDGKLYASTIDGELQQLSEEGTKWQVVRKTPTARFFHRMLPHEGRFVIVGGANMKTGKYEEVEVIDVK